MSNYDPSRGGHAPGHLRRAFCDWLEVVSAREDGEIPDTVIVGWAEEERPLRWLIGQLWNCSDQLPGGVVGDLFDLFEFEAAFTYAAAVRKLTDQLDAKPDQQDQR